MAKKTTKNGRLLVTYPVLQGNGSKYTATNIAHALKVNDSDVSVALVDLDFKSPFLAGYLSGHDNIHTIDNLIERIDGGFLDEEAVENNMVELKNGVHLLKGTKLKNTYYFIKQEHIRQILIMLKKMYDFVIVAVSNGNDSLSTTVTMLSADHVLLVSKNDYSNFSALENEIEFVQNYAIHEDNIKLIFNMYDPTSDLDFEHILSSKGVPLISWVPYNIETVNNKNIGSTKMMGKFIKSRKEEGPYDLIVAELMEKLK